MIQCRKLKIKNKFPLAENGGYMGQREEILEGTLQAFNQKGLKFTMDDVARILHMSKKKIYNLFFL